MTDKNIQVASEIVELLALADKKGLASITDTNQRLARLSAILAYKEINDKNISFFGYEDIAGNKSSGKKGMIIAFNSKFKKAFGFEVDNANSQVQSKFVETARLKAAEIMAFGVSKQYLREDVKKQVWLMIEHLGNAYKAIEGLK